MIRALLLVFITLVFFKLIHDSRRDGRESVSEENRLNNGEIY